MGVIDDGKLQSILPKYNELKLSGKNLAQQYVSAFNTGMNIYQCVNQLQGYTTSQMPWSGLEPHFSER